MMKKLENIVNRHKWSALIITGVAIPLAFIGNVFYQEIRPLPPDAITARSIVYEHPVMRRMGSGAFICDGEDYQKPVVDFCYHPKFIRHEICDSLAGTAVAQIMKRDWMDAGDWYITFYERSEKQDSTYVSP